MSLDGKCIIRCSYAWKHGKRFQVCKYLASTFATAARSFNENTDLLIILVFVDFGGVGGELAS